MSSSLLDIFVFFPGASTKWKICLPFGFLLLIAIGLDLYALTFREMKGFPLNSQEVKLFAEGSTLTKIWFPRVGKF